MKLKNRIQIDGKTLESLSQDYREASDFQWYFQDSFLFYGTVRIISGWPDQRHQIQKSCRRLWQRMPMNLTFGNGYDALVGERGATLSGGRKDKDCHCQSDIKECANSDSGR